MENTIEVNGQKYIKADSRQAFIEQRNSVLAKIGETMSEALVEARAMIAGGAVISAFTHAETNDIDVYFRSKESLAKAFEAVTKDWENVYLGHTDKSITLKDRETDTVVQFIYFDYFDSLEEVFKAFDFTVCMAGIDLHNSSIHIDERFIPDIASRTLHFNRGTRFPYISLIRTKKYQEKGYKIGRGSILAIAQACANMKITSWDEAKEQLGGVYGDEIEIKIEEGREFNEDELNDVLTSIPEKREFVVNLSDYEKIYTELTGKEWGVNYDDLPF